VSITVVGFCFSVGQKGCVEMLFIKRKHISSFLRTTRCSRHTGKPPQLCPKTGELRGRFAKYPWLIWLFPIIGFVSLIWFLIRVVPKPSRAAYPCQRLAGPLAGGFTVWLTGLLFSTLAYRKARRFFHQSRYVLAGIFAAVAIIAIWFALSITADEAAKAWTPTEPPNTPMGTAKGIYPGRVIWLYEPDSTSWDGSTGSWWDDNNTDQAIVHRMVSTTIQTLTGQSNDPNAWDAFFRYFNQTHGFGDIGYQYGEKVAIKINMNQDSGGAWIPGDGMPSPHVIYSVLDQLINAAQVPGSAITIYDASRYIGDPIYNKVRNNPDLNFQQVRFVVNPSYAKSGRIGAIRDTSGTVYSSYPGCPDPDMPLCVTEAKYLINMALLRQHTLYAVTLCGKNHFGSVYCGGWTPSPLHSYGDRNRGMGTYNCLVDLIGSRYLGGKTMLYMIDGLYAAQNQSADVIRFESFGNDWCSSIFASQDPVAIDSVALDFLRNEPTNTQIIGSVDNYLHEAALADNPPSGTFYDPDHSGDVVRLSSLGTHEHWNNAGDRQYSRNLGTGNGIELLQASLPPGIDFSGDGKINFEDYSILAQYWSEDEPSVDIAPVPLRDGIVNFKDLSVLVGNWLTGTKIPPLPGPASNPEPVNGTSYVDINTDLSWTAGTDATSYDVYFGTSEPLSFMGNQTAATFEPGTLGEATMYYWRIDSVNGWGKTAGEVWMFFTSMPPP
jgi:hypothetical protein